MSRTMKGINGLAKVANEKGLNISGYVHNIDNSAIYHTNKRHGITAREERRGQIAVTNEDYKNIPNLIYRADFVAFGAKSDKGLDLIIYGKNMPDGSSVYIEEVRTGQRTLTTKSLRKYKTGVNPSSFAKRISNAHGDTGTISIVTKEGIVKRYFDGLKKFSNNSKVVDEQGSPIVVYHGTSKNIHAFDPNKRGELTGAKSAKEGFWFVDDNNTSRLRTGSYIPGHTGSTNSIANEGQNVKTQIKDILLQGGPFGLSGNILLTPKIREILKKTEKENK